MTWALVGLLREGLGRDGTEGVRPRRGPGRQWVRPAWGRQRAELGEQWWACQDLNLGPHPYQRSAPRLVSPGSHLAPGQMMNH
jgi:hypothetical protein